MDSLDLRFSKSILLKLYIEGSCLKTNLQDIVKNLYSLDKLLTSLSKDGLINIDVKTFGKNIQEISLTTKGRQVAEDLRNMDRINKRKSLELQPIFKLILFISEKGECKLSELKDEFPGSYSYIEDLKAEGIIEASIDNSKFPSETIISLKEKGKLIAQKLKELEEILKV